MKHLLQPIDYQHPNAKTHLGLSLKETGFAVIKNHPILYAKDIYEAWRQAFISHSLKSMPFHPKKLDGLVTEEQSEVAVGFEKKDLKTFFNFYPGWGRCPDQLKEITSLYFNSIAECGQQIALWLDELTPIEKKQSSDSFVDLITQSKRNLLRINYFPALGANYEPGAIRAQDHTDINFFTIIPRTTSKGLQVLYKNNQWIDVPHDENWLIINIGDMLQECSDHYWPSTRHRVINPSENILTDRLSTPLFFQPNDNVFLSERYPRSIEFLERRYQDLGLI